MIILGIESSCDETAAAVLESSLKGGAQRIQILSNVVSSSLLMHAKYGGVIPEQAAREQLKLIIPVIEESLQVSGYSPQEIDAVAVTYGPGLIGSLLVGVETAKTLATVWQKPLIPVNHLLGHFYANWIDESSIKYPVFGIKQTAKSPNTNYLIHNTPQFPCIGLLVSGGHTDLVLFKDHGVYEYLGSTRDDAAGECFDKCARVLGYTYPGGPKISKLAQLGDSKKYHLPRPMADSKDLDFSFSGLKTAFINLIDANFNIDRGHFDSQKQRWTQTPLEEQLTEKQLQEVYNICACLQEAIIDILVQKTITAAQKYRVEQIIVAGGVAANHSLVHNLKLKISNSKLNIKLNIPPTNLCTDNAAMIAAAGFFQKEYIEPTKLQANPNLNL